MEAVKKIRRASRSKTIKWGHIQMVIGTVGTGLALVSPATLPDLPAWVYGLCVIGAGMITYLLRNVTRKPLDEL